MLASFRVEHAYPRNACSEIARCVAARILSRAIPSVKAVIKRTRQAKRDSARLGGGGIGERIRTIIAETHHTARVAG
jgi:hypothetical protein